MSVDIKSWDKVWLINNTIFFLFKIFVVRSSSNMLLCGFVHFVSFDRWKTTFDRRQPSMEDNLQWKMTFVGRRLSVEEDLCWKRTFGGRLPLVEDDLWWKTTFGGRWSLVEDNLWWKTTFSGRQPSVEDDLRRKTTFRGRWHLVEEDLWWPYFCEESENLPRILQWFIFEPQIFCFSAQNPPFWTL